MIALARSVFGFAHCVTHVFQPGQGRINHTGAGAVAASHALFDALYDLVAVARLFGDHRESDKPQFPIVKEPAAAAAATVVATMIPVMPPVTAIRQVIG